MAGPTSDYGYTSFGSDVHTPGYVTESAHSRPRCGADGNCTYTFTHAVPAGATGTYAIGVEARRTETLLPGTTTQQKHHLRSQEPGDELFRGRIAAGAARAAVVATDNCNQCHVTLSLHGGLRNNTEYCVMCHNPSNTDVHGARVRDVPRIRRCRRRASISTCWCIAFTTASICRPPNAATSWLASAAAITISAEHCSRP